MNLRRIFDALLAKLSGVQTSVPSAEGLTAVLDDPAAEAGERQDAAMDLRFSDEQVAEDALLRVASDPATERVLADICGESLAEMWSRRGRLNTGALKRLGDPALRAVIGVTRMRQPEWIDRIVGEIGIERVKRVMPDHF